MSLNSQNMPQTRHGGKVMGARRLAYELAGNEIKPGNVVFPKCNNRKCINPSHTSQSTSSKFMSAKNKTQVRTVATRKKISDNARKNAKLTPELVNEIKNSSKSGRQWARDTGIGLKTIWNAINGRTWKEYGSPWSGLGARS